MCYIILIWFSQVCLTSLVAPDAFSNLYSMFLTFENFMTFSPFQAVCLPTMKKFTDCCASIKISPLFFFTVDYFVEDIQHKKC